MRLRKKIKDKIFKEGIIPTQEEREAMKTVYRDDFMNKGKRKFSKS